MPTSFYILIFCSNDDIIRCLDSVSGIGVLVLAQQFYLEDTTC